MTIIDLVGFIGVFILLLAYFLNLKDFIKKESMLYLSLNFIGALIACLASVLLRYLPFVILEGAWTLVSAYGIWALYKRKP